MSYWVWLLVAVLVVFAEVVASTGFLFIWVGIAAVFVGIISYLSPHLGFVAQLFIFTLAFLAAFFGGRKLWSLLPKDPDAVGLNNRAERYIGRVLMLTDDINNGKGRLWIDNVTWIIYGPDLKKGDRVKVIATDGVSLTVVEDL